VPKHGERSIYTKVVENMAKRIIDAKAEARRARPVPFMQETVSAQTYRNLTSGMTREERMELLEEMFGMPVEMRRPEASPSFRPLQLGGR